MKALQETEAQRLVEALDQEIRRRPRGAIRAVDRAAGYQEGWWQHRVASGDISVSQLLKVLRHLGLDPVKFVRRVVGSEKGLELDRPRGPAPEIVARAWRRYRTRTPGLGIGRTYLETLDQQRLEEPHEVIRLALWAVDHVELDLLSWLLGVSGSAWRHLILLDEAEHAIHAGIVMATQDGDRSAVGTLLQRLSYVVADQGDRNEALRISERATMTFLRCGDRSALARSIVDQGIWLFNLDRAQEAIATLEDALKRLPPEPSRNRFATLQNLGLAHHRLGNLQESRKLAQAAEQALPKGNPWDQGKLLWLRARIDVDYQRLDQATRTYEEIIALFQDLHHGETALVTCELVRCHLMQGNPAAAYKAATSMYALLQPLRGNRIISAAIGDLLRGGQQGLTLALVAQVMVQIEGERQQAGPWRALANKSAAVSL